MLANKTIQVNDAVYDYLFRNSIREPDVMRRLREETYTLGEAARMMSPPESAQLLALLIEITGARRVIEVGVFTGYTTLAKALALPPDGRIVACDMSEEWTSIARRYWHEAGIADKVDLRLAPASKTLRELQRSGQAGGFDMMFIDANKSGYDGYYEAGLKLVRVGGLIVIDNVLWGGAVADPKVTDEDTAAIRALNAKVMADERVGMVMLPVSDGITICRRRG